ncbi:hypothetical protein CWS02_17520 [Enterobacter sp. EA-1]|nr:hypothetical protein CWS02_17520 [Enterobacter sp. EA-1]
MALSGHYQPDDRQTRRAHVPGDPVGLFLHPVAGKRDGASRSRCTAAVVGGRSGNAAASDYVIGGWQLLNLLPLQQITTTNSGELLSMTPVEQVCRLVRESSRVAARRLGPGGLSAEDARRISFHIRVNRPSSLFARCWLLGGRGNRKLGD